MSFRIWNSSPGSPSPPLAVFAVMLPMAHLSSHYRMSGYRPVHFSSLFLKMLVFTPCHILFDHIQFTLIHGPNIPASYTVLFFTASDFTFTSRHIHNWMSFPLLPGLFILSGATVIALCSFPVVYWTPSDVVGLIFWCHIYLPFHIVHGVLMARILEWFAIISSSGPRFVRTLLWPTVHGASHSFIEFLELLVSNARKKKEER